MEDKENKVTFTEMSPLKKKDIGIATEAVILDTDESSAEKPKPKPKSVTRIGPEDECSDEEAFGQEMKNADALVLVMEGGDQK